MLEKKVLDAAKQAYDMCGGEVVLQDISTLPNALDDLLGKDGKILKNQVRMAMDAGLGNLTLKQLASPTKDFRKRVVELLADNGMSEAAAEDMYVMFTYMTGIKAESVGSEDKDVPPKKKKDIGTTKKEQGVDGGHNTGEFPPVNKKKTVDKKIDDAPKTPIKDPRLYNMAMPTQCPQLTMGGGIFVGVGFLFCSLGGSGLIDMDFCIAGAMVALAGIVMLIVSGVLHSRHFGKVTARVIGNEAVFTVEKPQTKIIGIAINKKWVAFVEPGATEFRVPIGVGKSKFSLSIINAMGPSVFHAGGLIRPK